MVFVCQTSTDCTGACGREKQSILLNVYFYGTGERQKEMVLIKEFDFHKEERITSRHLLNLAKDKREGKLNKGDSENKRQLHCADLQGCKI